MGRRGVGIAAAAATAVLACIAACGLFGGDDGPASCDDRDPAGKLTFDCAKTRARSATQGRPLRLYGVPVAVAAGTTIEEGIPDEAAPITTGGESWFFFADLAPGARYDHPTAFVLVDRASGDVQVLPRSSFPVIGGVSWFLRADQLADPSLVVADTSAAASAPGLHLTSKWAAPTPVATPGVTYPDPSDPRLATFDWSGDAELPDERLRRFMGRYELPQDDDASAAELARCAPVDCNVSESRKLALVATGNDVEWKQSARLATLLRGAGWAVTELSSDGVPGATPTTPANLRAALDDLAKTARCCDQVLVVLLAHGSPSGLLMMNPRRKEDDGDGGMVERGDPAGGFLGPYETRTKLDAIPSCRTHVLVEACFSGSWIEDAGVNVLPDTLDTRDGGMCRVVATATSQRQYGRVGDLTYFVDGMQAALAADPDHAKGVEQLFAESFLAEKGRIARRSMEDPASNQCPHVQASDPAACCRATNAPFTTVAGPPLLQRPRGLASDATSLFVVDWLAGAVWRLAKDGSSAPLSLATGLSHPAFVAADDRWVYVSVTGTGAADGAILRISKDGQATVPLVSGVVSPIGIAVDTDQVYFTAENVPDDAGTRNGAVLRVPKTGGSPVTVATDLLAPYDVQVVGAALFVTTEAAVLSIPAAGGSPRALTPVSPAFWQHVASDGTNVFFTSEQSGGVFRARLADGARDELLTGPGKNAVALAANPADPFVYFADGASLWRLRKDAPAFAVPAADSGVHLPEAIVPLAGNAEGIVVDDDAVYWTTGNDGRVLRVCKPSVSSY